MVSASVHVMVRKWSSSSVCGKQTCAGYKDYHAGYRACFHFEEWWQALSFMSFLSVFDLGKEPLTES